PPAGRGQRLRDRQPGRVAQRALPAAAVGPRAAQLRRAHPRAGPATTQARATGAPVMRLAIPAAALAALLATPAAALAEPPANDGPDGAVELSPYTAENGEPSELQGSADLSEAGPDAGVPRCL